MKRKREIVAIIIPPLLYLYIMKLPPLCFLLLISLISSFAQIEFYVMYGVKGPVRFFGTICGVILIYLFYLGLNEVWFFLIVVFMFIILVRLFSGRRPENALSDISPLVVGLLYIPLILGLQVLIRKTGPEWIIYTAGTVWVSDSFAYYVGKNFGRRKLYASVSPKKTVAGAVGSLAGGMAASVLIKVLLIGSITVYQSIIYGLLIGGVTVLGDLSESMFKRDAGVKDSSLLIPGHGGVLDKIDGIIYATPVVYIIIRFLIT